MLGLDFPIINFFFMDIILYEFLLILLFLVVRQLNSHILPSWVENSSTWQFHWRLKIQF